ncbi:very short patch repair endonuclease [Brachybacterium fresconis]|uniref:very short patch repair endonuclease n=1 Tax=Brachybacterium fresconis TaxID=173363 RepID=UPI001AE3E6B9
MSTDPSRREGQLSADSLTENERPTSSLSSEEPVEETVRARMAVQRRRDTAPELALRRSLHRAGLRFRVDHPLPGIPRRRADVVFTRVNLAVFVDGCFWHDCPEHGTRPKSRAAWWEEKLRRNVERDHDTDTRLGEAGWTVLRFWEHEDMAQAAIEVLRTYRFLRVTGQRRRGPSSTTGGRSG